MSFQGALKWLSSLDYVSQQSEIFAKRQPGTGQWLLDSLEFRRWMDTPGSTLFCPGVPGAGKTVLTSVVVNHLSSTFIEGPKVGIAYAYVDSLRDSGQALDQALCSLISQLALIHSEGGQAVKALRNGHTGKRTRPSTDETMGLLDTVTKSQSPSRVFVLIDAMDECQISGECWAGFLTRLFRLQGAHVNLFVTSSFTAEIMTAFDGRASIVEIRATDHDLRTYVDGQIDSLPACVKDNIKLQEDIKTTITSASHGMYVQITSFILQQLIKILTGFCWHMYICHHWRTSSRPNPSGILSASFRSKTNRLELRKTSSKFSPALMTKPWVGFVKSLTPETWLKRPWRGLLALQDRCRPSSFKSPLL